MTANQRYRKALLGTDLEYYDARQACEDIKPGSYDKLPYTSRILAENLVNRADKVDLPTLQSWLGQLIEGKQEIDFPWYPARVVCHDILGQTALVDLAGLRDAIAEKGGDPSKVNRWCKPSLSLTTLWPLNAAVTILMPSAKPRNRRQTQRRPFPLHQLDKKPHLKMWT